MRSSADANKAKHSSEQGQRQHHAALCIPENLACRNAHWPNGGRCQLLFPQTEMTTHWSSALPKCRSEASSSRFRHTAQWSSSARFAVIMVPRNACARKSCSRTPTRPARRIFRGVSLLDRKLHRCKTSIGASQAKALQPWHKLTGEIGTRQCPHVWYL